jgi:hypothetical protein
VALRGMAAIGARNLGAPFGLREELPTSKELLETIGTYIPTDVSTLYIAVAGGMAALTPAVSTDLKLNVAWGFAALAGFAEWVLVHREAQKQAKDPAKPPNALQTLRAGLYEIVAAPIALFVWATAMPASWFDWGAYSAIGPVAAVGIVTIVVGGLAVILNRNRG